MSFIIRPYKTGDELGMAFAHSQSILKLCSKDYPAEVIVVWACKKPEIYRRNAESGDENFFVIEDSGSIVGIGGWSKNNISVCYLHPEVTGQGLARKLYQAVEDDYRTRTGNTYVNVESTLTAKGFYEKMGFVPQKAMKHTFNDGVTVLDCWDMRKDFA